MEVCTSNPTFEVMPQMEPNIKFFLKSTPRHVKVEILAKTEYICEFFENNFSCIYSGLKYKFWETMNKIGRLAFAQALGLHNGINNIYFDRHFLITFFISEDLKTDSYVEQLNIDFCTIRILSPYKV